MSYFRNRWRRGPIHRYFSELEPIDRATALIVLALLSAFVVSYAAIVRYHAQSVGAAQPRLTAPPFLMDFAAISVPA